MTLRPNRGPFPHAATTASSFAEKWAMAVRRRLLPVLREHDRAARTRWAATGLRDRADAVRFRRVAVRLCPPGHRAGGERWLVPRAQLPVRDEVALSRLAADAGGFHLLRTQQPAADAGPLSALVDALPGGGRGNAAGLVGGVAPRPPHAGAAEPWSRTNDPGGRRGAVGVGVLGLLAAPRAVRRGACQE